MSNVHREENARWKILGLACAHLFFRIRHCMLLFCLFCCFCLKWAWLTLALEQKLVIAAEQLDGISQKLCLFISDDLPADSQQEAKPDIISWVKTGKSFYEKQVFAGR